MTMAGLISSRIKDPDNAPLRAEVAMRVYPRGSLGIGEVPAAPTYPYVMYAMGESVAVTAVRDTAQAEVQPWEIYVYDKPGSYVRIKRIHRLARETLLELGGASDPADGTFCVDITYERRGREQYDQVTKSALMTAEYRVVQTEH